MDRAGTTWSYFCHLFSGTGLNVLESQCRVLRVATKNEDSAFRALCCCTELERRKRRASTALRSSVVSGSEEATNVSNRALHVCHCSEVGSGNMRRNCSS